MAAMGKKVADAGGLIVEILAAKGGAQPSRADLDAWVSAYNLPVTTVKDPDAMALQSLNQLVRREYSYVVDLSTMKILKVYIGSIAGIGTSSAQSAMQALMSLLGNR